MDTKIIAERTVAICRDGFYTAPSGRRVEVGAALEKAKAATRLWRPADFPEPLTLPEGAPTFETRLEATGETTLDAAARLAAEGVEPLCLNFASAKNPGGGFLNGAQAQEESLARSSGLYPCLLTCQPFYDFHRTQADLLYSDHMIHSPGVPVFATDDGRLLERPFTAAFLTSPAPNAGAVLRLAPERAGEIYPAMERRLARLLWLAHREGHRALVLGAWGCGVFRCDPERVAALFSQALSGPFAGRFERVIFAVYDRSKAQSCLGAFTSRFAGG